MIAVFMLIRATARLWSSVFNVLYSSSSLNLLILNHNVSEITNMGITLGKKYFAVRNGSSLSLKCVGVSDLLVYRKNAPCHKTMCTQRKNQ